MFTADAPAVCGWSRSAGSGLSVEVDRVNRINGVMG